VRILTDDAHTKARIREIDDRRLHADLEAGNVVVVAGFQGVDEHGNITTLGSRRLGYHGGRAGGGAQGRRMPDLHRRGRRVHHGPAHRRRRAAPRPITFEEMLEMASMGSKVLQIRAVEFAGKYNVPLRVLHSFRKARAR
jgi:aspartate kinase